MAGEKKERTDTYDLDTTKAAKSASNLGDVFLTAAKKLDTLTESTKKYNAEEEKRVAGVKRNGESPFVGSGSASGVWRPGGSPPSMTRWEKPIGFAADTPAETTSPASALPTPYRTLDYRHRQGALADAMASRRSKADYDERQRLLDKAIDGRGVQYLLNEEMRKRALGPPDKGWGPFPPTPEESARANRQSHLDVGNRARGGQAVHESRQMGLLDGGFAHQFAERDARDAAMKQTMLGSSGGGSGGGRPPVSGAAAGGGEPPDQPILRAFNYQYGPQGVTRAVAGRLDSGLGFAPGAGPTTVGIAAVTAVSTAMQRLTPIVNMLSDGMTTHAQKQRALIEAIIPGAETFRKFIQALNGTTEAMAAQSRDTQRIQVAIQQAGQTASLESEQRVESTAAYARAEGVRQNPLLPWMGGQFDRTSSSGRIQYGEYAQRLSADDAVVRAQREERSAGIVFMGQAKATSDSERKLTGAQRALEIAREDRDKILEEENKRPTTTVQRNGAAVAYMGQGGMMPSRGFSATNATVSATSGSAPPVQDLNKQKALDAVNQAQSAFDNAANQAITERNRQKQVELDLEKASLAVQQAKVEAVRVEADILKQRADRMENRQSQLGSLSRGQYEQGKMALQSVLNNGLENASPIAVNLARQVDPQQIAKMELALGGGRAREMVDRFGAKSEGNYDFMSDKKTLQQVQKESDAETARARAMSEQAENRYATRVANRIEESLSRIFKIMEDRIADMGKRLEQKLQQRAAASIN